MGPFGMNMGSNSGWGDGGSGGRGGSGGHRGGGPGWGGGWGGGSWSGWGGSQRGGPPPWVAGLIQMAQQETKGPRRPQPPPRARRGDVRAAVLDVLGDGARNGYQLIQEISDRTGGAWKPSPGSIYPTLAQLEDEGLIEADAERGRRSFRLTVAGQHYRETNPEEMAEVWKPFTDDGPTGSDEGFGNLMPELGKLMNAVWQVVSTGTKSQQLDAAAVVVETRRRLYGILADEDGSDLRPTPDSDQAPEQQRTTFEKFVDPVEQRGSAQDAGSDPVVDDEGPEESKEHDA